jgi:hypothetical protein
MTPARWLGRNFARELPPPRGRQLIEMMDIAVPAFAPFRNHCIAAARVLTLAASQAGVQNRAVPVFAVVANAAMLELHNTPCPEDPAEAKARGEAMGAWFVRLGDPGHSPAPGLWAGHVVVLLWGDVLVDITLSQVGRGVLPVVGRAPLSWLDGEPCAIAGDGWQVEYEHRPENKSFKKSPDWTEGRRHPQTVASLSQALGGPLPKPAEPAKRTRKKRGG